METAASTDSQNTFETLEKTWRAWQHQPSAELEERLTKLRQLAAQSLSPEPGHDSWPPKADNLFPEHRHGLVEIDPAQLNMQTLASAVTHHGALLVRGMIPEHRLERLRHGIDQAIEMHDAWREGTSLEQTSPWFRAHPEITALSPTDLHRKWARKVQGIFTIDSPYMLAAMLDAYSEAGVLKCVQDYLGEHPVISGKKATLRRVEPDLEMADWHQDGRFLEQGQGIRTINTWLALSHCGESAPGMDIIARRLDRFVETGTHSAHLPWTVAQEVVEQSRALKSAWVRPVFRPGDMLFFDEYNLHRTDTRPGLTEQRYAIETWFFTPSRRPRDDIFLAV